MPNTLLKISSETMWIKLPQLQLAAGEITCLHGESGAGKSRLLRAIADLDPNDLHAFLTGRARNEIAPSQWRKQLQHVPAEPVWWTETAGEMLSHDCQTLADNLGLDQTLLDKPVSQLSTGERQRCALLRALSVEPNILLLDEPTAALDASSTGRVEALLRHWVSDDSQRAVIWVSHDAEQRARVADQQWRIENGVLQCQ